MAGAVVWGPSLDAIESLVRQPKRNAGTSLGEVASCHRSVSISASVNWMVSGGEQ